MQLDVSSQRALLLPLLLLLLPLATSHPSARTVGRRAALSADADARNGSESRSPGVSKRTTVKGASVKLEGGDLADDGAASGMYPKDLIETIMESADALTGKESANNTGQKVIDFDLSAAREELLRDLESEATEYLDTNTNEKVRTISEAQFRAALERVIAKHVTLKTGQGAPAEANSSSKSPVKGTSLSSQLVCQFFIFGTLFGVVCSISTCTCCLQPRPSRRRFCVNGVNPTNVPAPIDYSKPYVLKCDGDGSCYASPLSDGEVPPLPPYNLALKCATQPIATAATVHASHPLERNLETL